MDAANGDGCKTIVFSVLEVYRRLVPRMHCWLLEVNASSASNALHGEKRGGERNNRMTRFGVLSLVAGLAMAGVTGCATKNYVRNQTAPLVDQTNQQEDKTANNNRQLHDVDDRAQAGIRQAQGAADTANQNAQGATKAAGDAESAANNAVHRADSLDSVVKGLDDYKPMANVAVTFGFDKAVLTKDDRDQLDSFAGQISSAKSFILEVTGGTDSTGPAEYNYELSQRRADAVVQYLASKYAIPAHRFYLIGIGKDKEVAPNTTAEGRKQNRRVEVRLLSNMGSEQQQSASNLGTQ
jgi:outer membrane protein OmpA-like peptidoglycan-associated protein